MRKAIRLSLVGSALAALIGGSGLMMPVESCERRGLLRCRCISRRLCPPTCRAGCCCSASSSRCCGCAKVPCR